MSLGTDDVANFRDICAYHHEWSCWHSKGIHLHSQKYQAARSCTSHSKCCMLLCTFYASMLYCTYSCTLSCNLLAHKHIHNTINSFPCEFIKFQHLLYCIMVLIICFKEGFVKKCGKKLRSHVISKIKCSLTCFVWTHGCI